MKRKSVICLMLILILVVISPVTSMASTDYQKQEKVGNTKTMYLDVNQFNNESDLLKSVTSLLSDENVDEVIVLNSTVEPDEASLSSSTAIQPMLGVVTFLTVRNVKALANSTGTTVIATAKGTPGITLSISKTSSISTTLSATFGIAKKSISSAVGWSVTGSTSITISGSAKVPSTYNNKKVKTMSLNARIIYKVKSYEVWQVTSGLPSKKKGKGTTKKAYGVSFTKSYVYK